MKVKMGKMDTEGTEGRKGGKKGTEQFTVPKTCAQKKGRDQMNKGRYQLLHRLCPWPPPLAWSDFSPLALTAEVHKVPRNIDFAKEGRS